MTNIIKGTTTLINSLLSKNVLRRFCLQLAQTHWHKDFLDMLNCKYTGTLKNMSCEIATTVLDILLSEDKLCEGGKASPAWRCFLTLLPVWWQVRMTEYLLVRVPAADSGFQVGACVLERWSNRAWALTFCFTV